MPETLESPKSISFYEQDFYLWILDMVERLKTRDFDHLDKDSPSLKRVLLERLPSIWQDALKAVRFNYPQVIFPDTFPGEISLELLLKKPIWSDLPSSTPQTS